MTTLDTTVEGDVDSVRTAAEGVGALAGGLDGAGAGFGSAVGQSDSQWSGSAGDAFRGKITSAQQATRTAADAAHQVRAAMHTFADRMDQVKAKMKQAESIASGAGLTVSGNSIQAPKPPAAPPNACYPKAVATALIKQYQAAVAKYRRQVAAYQKAEQIIKQARQEEQTAHADLSRTNQEADDLLSELKDSKYWIAGDTALSTAERGLEQAEGWAKKAEHYTERFNGLIDDLDTLPAGTPAKLAQLRTVSRALGDLDNANDAEDANKVLALGLDPKYLKYLKAAGYVFSAGELVHDVLDPKDRVRNIAADAASTGTGVAADELIGELALDGALETGGVSLAAGALAIGAGYVVKHYGPGLVNWAEKKLGDFEHGLTHPFGI